MKRLFILFTVSLTFFVFATDFFAQSFFTGAIGVNQSNGGRQRVFSDNLSTRQMERISILVGVSSSAVFDYNEDQNSEIPAATVASREVGSQITPGTGRQRITADALGRYRSEPCAHVPFLNLGTVRAGMRLPCLQRGRWQRSCRRLRTGLNHSKHQDSCTSNRYGLHSFAPWLRRRATARITACA